MQNFLFKPIDIASLVLFRIVAGVLLAFEVLNTVLNDDYLNYITPKFNFSYQFFPWVKPLPEPGMYLLIGVTVFAAFMVAAGAFYRVSAVVLTLGYTLLFLMEATEYVNHWYLYCLLCFFLVIIPAHRAFSVDVRRNPALERSFAPAWALYLLIFQISLVYFFAGIAKLQPDWLQAKPLQVWLAYKTDRPVVGPLLALPLAPFFMSYAGIVLDLLFAPLLLWPRTRWLGLACAVFFHISNVFVFGLATFPWFSLLLTSLYFSPSWPRKFKRFNKTLPDYDAKMAAAYAPSHQKIIVSFIVMYAAVQILLPLRHWLYPGNVNWTEEGHKFSWRMMLRAKSGSVYYKVVFNDAEKPFVYEYPHHYLSDHQINKLADHPDLILQFAHFLRDKYKADGYDKVKIFAISYLSLNGRPTQPLVNPETDLAKESRSIWPYKWITRLKD